ncbi:hypothetical protein NBRC110019_26360 [Neptunitalea chrysea]|uniref:Uncharacterized protein n=1 Tax=Neptunitalea chrysea TaxID=1647581 RepID=A0A9W6B8C9_9FLAO|nr:hypothetical protein [Neptunitalea chrysea]GLB53595.1 hypothetical protein NBRC110019_26360 [Neptunitalea chrysea]
MKDDFKFSILGTFFNNISSEESSLLHSDKKHIDDLKRALSSAEFKEKAKEHIKKLYHKK